MDRSKGKRGSRDATQLEEFEIPKKAMDLGVRRTAHIFRNAIYHPNAGPLVIAFAVAYLQGVEDGWTACEKQNGNQSIHGS